MAAVLKIVTTTNTYLNILKMDCMGKWGILSSNMKSDFRLDLPFLNGGHFYTPAPYEKLLILSYYLVRDALKRGNETLHSD